MNSSITNWIGDILAVVFLFLYFLSFNEARIIFLLCWVACLWICEYACVYVCPSQLAQCKFVHYYLVVLISWMGTKKTRLSFLVIYFSYFGLLTFSEWIGIILGSCAHTTEAPKYIMNQKKEGNETLEMGTSMRKDIKIEYVKFKSYHLAKRRRKSTFICYQ